MKFLDSSWHVEDNVMLGYKWSTQAEYGIIIIDEDELFMRIEFAYMLREECVSYAMTMGWRYNVDSGRWYRIRGY